MTRPRYVSINFQATAEEYGHLIDAMTPEMKQLTRSNFIRAAINAYVGECVLPLILQGNVWERRS